LDREVERKLAQRHGLAVIEVWPGCEVELVRKAGTRVEVVRRS
jgi:hypothetical protein